MAVGVVGRPISVTIAVTDGVAPRPDVAVEAWIAEGPNAHDPTVTCADPIPWPFRWSTGGCRTDSRGRATFTFISHAPGVDRWNFAGDGVSGAQLAVLWRDPNVSYVAAGDSFSSGEGAHAYEGGQRWGVHPCHRSRLAYSTLLSGAQLYSQLARRGFVACTGAVSANFFTSRSFVDGTSQPAQLQAITSATRIVTYSIGGNDIGFANILRECTVVPRFPRLLNGKHGCTRSATFFETYQPRRLALKDRNGALSAKKTRIWTVAEIANKIADRTSDVDVYIVGYPRLFAPVAANMVCRAGSVVIPKHYTNGSTDTVAALLLRGDDTTWLNTFGDDINKTLASAVRAYKPPKGKSMRLHFVDPNPWFQQHRLCDPKIKPYLNGMQVGVFPSTDNPLVPVGLIDPASMHPNAAGQGAYASAVMASMRSTLGGSSPVIVNRTLPIARTGPYNARLLEGGQQSGVWRIVAGRLPDGFRLEGNRILGEPPQPAPVGVPARAFELTLSFTNDRGQSTTQRVRFIQYFPGGD